MQATRKLEINNMKFEDKGLDAWEQNAAFWDKQMGDESNYFHRDIVRPDVERMLNIQSDDLVLDIACGNGNFTERMVQQGASVVAFDYSPNMIQCATKRRASVLGKASFHICDATDYHALKQLAQQQPFTKAVANMAIMDISDIEPLFKAVYEMLEKGGCFVFAMHHPCFTYPNEDYFTSNIEKGVAIEGQPALQNYYHRSLSDLLNEAFKIGFVLDALAEVPFAGEQKPITITARVVKKS